MLVFCCIVDFNLFRLLFSLLGFRGGIRCQPSDGEALSPIYELTHVKYQGSIFHNPVVSKECKHSFDFVRCEAVSVN